MTTLDARDARAESPSSKRRLPGGILYAGICLVGALAVVLTLAVPQPIDVQSRESHYGMPFWFASTDMSAHGAPPGYRATRWEFNPWENPVRFRFGGFLLSWLLVIAIPLTVSWLGLARRRRRDRATDTQAG